MTVLIIASEMLLNADSQQTKVQVTYPDHTVIPVLPTVIVITETNNWYRKEEYWC